MRTHFKTTSPAILHFLSPHFILIAVVSNTVVVFLLLFFLYPEYWCRENSYYGGMLIKDILSSHFYAARKRHFLICRVNVGKGQILTPLVLFLNLIK